MKRFIIGRLVAIALATAFAAGCAVASTSQVDDDESSATGDESVSAGEDSLVRGGNGAVNVVRNSLTKPTSDSCAGCGPHPEPWQMGPHPEPWTEPTPSSSSSGGNDTGTGGSKKH